MGMAHHCSHAPDIGTGAPFRAQDHLGRPILPSLDIIRKVVINPARVTQVGNLDANDVETESIIVGLALLAC